MSNAKKPSDRVGESPAASVSKDSDNPSDEAKRKLAESKGSFNPDDVARTHDELIATQEGWTKERELLIARLDEMSKRLDQQETKQATDAEQAMKTQAAMKTFQSALPGQATFDPRMMQGGELRTVEFGGFIAYDIAVRRGHIQGGWFSCDADTMPDGIRVTKVARSLKKFQYDSIFGAPYHTVPHAIRHKHTKLGMISTVEQCDKRIANESTSAGSSNAGIPVFLQKGASAVG